MKIRVASAAEDEIIEAIQYYLSESVQAAGGFENELEECFSAIVKAPRMYAESAPGVRYRMLRRYPYSVHYRITEDRIEVLSVAHHSRAQGYWLNRND